MDKMIKKVSVKKIAIGLGVIVLFVVSPFFQVVKSYAVMAVYSGIHEHHSFLEDEGIKIKIPGGLRTLGKDYYPFVMTYDSSKAFSDIMGEEMDLVILYNFGAMNWMEGASLIYDTDSPYYSSFYGAYAVAFEDRNRQFGLDDQNQPNIEEIMKVTDHDLKQLVLKSVGDSDPYVVYKVNNRQFYDTVIHNQHYLTFDADIEMDGMMHIYNKDYSAYIQYGRPPKKEQTSSFDRIQVKGRIYMYFDKSDKISYFFYSIAPETETVDYIEEQFILKSKIIE